MRIKDYGQLTPFNGDVYCWSCEIEHLDIEMIESEGTKYFKCPVDGLDKDYNPRDWIYQ